MFKFIKDHKKEITISIVTGILVFCIEPLLKYLGNLFVNTFLSVSESFSNDYYGSIATNYENIFSEMSSFFLILFYAIGVLSLILYMKRRRHEINNRIAKRAEEILKKNAGYVSTENVNPPAQIAIRSRESEQKILKLHAANKKRDYVSVFFITSLTVCVLLLFSSIAISSSVAKENVAFKNDLIKIDPFVQEQNIKLFKSKWAQMENKADYELITSEIDSIKKQHKLK